MTSLASVLAPAVGDERAAELVSEAMAEAMIAGPALSPIEARTILDRLSLRGGVVGVSARIARARLGDVGATGNDNGTRQRHGEKLVELLAPAVGEERARELVDSTCRKLGMRAEALDETRALRILDDLAASGGIVSVAARFAKARALLKAR